MKFPAGFFRLRSAEGKDLGIGFFCPGCAQTFFQVMAAGVTHCRRTEKYPTGFFGGPKDLPFVQMAARTGQASGLPANMILV